MAPIIGRSQGKATPPRRGGSPSASLGASPSLAQALALPLAALHAGRALIAGLAGLRCDAVGVASQRVSSHLLRQAVGNRDHPRGGDVGVELTHRSSCDSVSDRVLVCALAPTRHRGIEDGSGHRAHVRHHRGHLLVRPVSRDEGEVRAPAGARVLRALQALKSARRDGLALGNPELPVQGPSLNVELHGCHGDVLRVGCDATLDPLSPWEALAQSAWYAWRTARVVVDVLDEGLVLAGE